MSDNMDSRPTPPQKAHSKSASKVSTRENFDFDAKVEKATGRLPSKANTSDEGGLQRTTSARKAGVGMVPKPSSLPNDPLV